MLYLFDRFSRHPEFSNNSSLRAALLDAMYFCVMVGIGESFLSSFGIALGGSSLQIGVLVSLPAFIAALAQTIGLYFYRQGIARKTIMVRGAIVQGFTWFLLAFLAFSNPHGSVSAWVLVLLTIFFTTAGGITAPVWSSLIGDLVPARIRGEYFGFRNQRSGWIMVASMLLGGWFLTSARDGGLELQGFGILFVTAGLARISSAIWLNEYEEPGYKVNQDDHFSFWKFISRLPNSNFAKFVLFFSLMNAAASFSGAYFSLYVLRDLSFSYQEFSILMTTQMITQYVCMRNWGKLTDTYGNRRILSFCGWGVAFSSIIWIGSDNFWYMLLCQVYSGLFWSGFNLAGSNFMFDAVTPAKRAQCTAYMAVINTSLIAIGTLCGGLLVTYLPADFITSKGIFTTESIYYKLFIISAGIRFLILTLVLPKFSEVREVNTISSRKLLFTIAYVNSMAGPVFYAIGQAIKKKRN